MSATSSPSRASFEDPPLPTLLTFVHSVPPQLIALLAELGPSIAQIRRISETISWKTKNYAESWLLLGGWWAVCLFSDISLRYLLLLIGASLYVWYSKSTTIVKAKPPVTEQSLQATVIDLSVIESLRPSLPHIKPPILHWTVIARILAFLYIPYLLITYFVRLRTLVAISGTIAIAWRAQWARTIRIALWRSAWFRWALARIWMTITGEKTKLTVLSSESGDEFIQQGQSLRFLFTIHENQRWWVGLDWTAALLPGERPSWCSTTQEPMSPPSSFELPAPTCVYMGDGKGGLLKRTASWKWVESEWKVLVKREVGGSKRIEKEPPVTKDEDAQSKSRIGRTKNKVLEVKEKLKPGSAGDSGDADEVQTLEVNSTDLDLEDHHEDEGEPFTDNDGWVYGDNQWKGSSHKGGIGKYTRYRKWTRIAALSEIVEPATAEEAQNHATAQQKARQSLEYGPESIQRRNSTSPSQRRSLDATDDVDGDDRHGLRQRLKAAIRKTTISA